MDERTTRLLEITQAVDRAMGPMKPVLERLKPLNEFRNLHAALLAVSVVTDWKPLRAPGIQTRAHPEPVPVLRSPTAPEKPSQEVKLGNAKKKRVRQPGLMSEAIEKARKATKSEQAGILWTWISKNAADCFMDYDEDKEEFRWQGKQIPTNYDAFKKQLNRLSKKATSQDI